MANEQIFYQWSPETLFELKGQELEQLLDFVNFKLQSQEARETIALYEIKKAMDAKVEAGLKTGKVVVHHPPTKPEDTEE